MTSPNVRLRNGVVFLSYHSADMQLGGDIKNELSRLGFNVTTGSSQILPGEAWASILVESVKSANYIVVLMTEKTSSGVGIEIALALQNNLRILPVKIAPKAQVSPLLSRLQWLDASTMSTPGEIAYAIAGALATMASEGSLPTTKEAEDEGELLQVAYALANYESRLAAIKTRSRLNPARLWLPVLLLFTIVAVTALLIVSPRHSAALLSGISGAVTGLLGTAVGYYFGLFSRSDSND